jgi:hypothetical protein
MLEDSARYYPKKSRTVAGKDWCLIYKATTGHRKVAWKSGPLELKMFIQHHYIFISLQYFPVYEWHFLLVFV